ncbi:MAG: phage portal protein [Hyphomicrobiales bacterium]|nr:phage portal protein [Hyphomicrobiales bacterium]
MTTDVMAPAKAALAEILEPSRGDVSRPRASSAYFRGSSGGQIHLAGWNPALREPWHDVRAAWVQAAARAVEAAQNSGWIAGGVNTAVANVVGSGLKLNAKPDYEQLGWTAADAMQWSRRVEARFNEWCENPYECDVAGRMTFGQMQAAAYRSWLAYGETLALIPLIQRSGAASRTKVLLAPPNRLATTTLEPRVIHGVIVDVDGLTIGYRFLKRNPWGGDEEIEIAARDRDARPQVVHVFDGAVGQVRGISPLAPVLKVTRQYDQLADATLTTTLLQTVFAATLTSDSLGENAFEGLNPSIKNTGASAGVEAYMESRAQWYEAAESIDLGVHGRVATLFPGDKFEFNAAKTPNDNYERFSKGLLREIAKGLGVTYEDFTGDYSQVTYSSALMSRNANWPLTLYRRKHLATPLPRAVYEAWLEEEIGTGRTPFPGGLQAFLAQRAAVCRAEWHGPAKPVADDLKSAKAQDIRLKLGTATLASLAAEEGGDWEDNADQLAREVAAFRERGLMHPFVAEVEKAKSAATEREEDDEEEREDA